MPDPAVRIEGLKELRAGLRRIDPELAKALRDKFVPIAETVAGDARGRVPRGTGRAASSIRGGVSGANAYVAGGKKAVPYYGWLDFGTRTPVHGNPRHVGPWAGSGPGPAKGRFIYAAIAARHEEIEQAAAGAIDGLIDDLLPHLK